MTKTKIESQEEIERAITSLWFNFKEECINSPHFLPVHLRNEVAIDINFYTLAASIESARIDLKRWANFHLKNSNTFPDNHKYAAFLARWIAKDRPIYFTHKNIPIEIPEKLYLLNAEFALYAFRALLEEDLPENLVPHLIYLLHYRDCSGEVLSLLAYSCEEISRLRKTNTALLNKLSFETKDDPIAHNTPSNSPS